MNNRGSVSMVAAMMVLPMVMFLGLAVDASTMWMVNQRLRWSADTAALLGAAQLRYGVATQQIKIDAISLFLANVGASNPGNTTTAQTGYLGSTVNVPVVTVTNNTVTVAASATTSTMFMQVVPGFNKLVTTSVTSQGAVPSVEIALALDNSLSMSLPLANGTVKLDALKTAANNMVTTLFGAVTGPPNLSMSIVPFAGAVNIGPANTAFLDQQDYTANFKFKNGDSLDAAWRGCVMARNSPDDLSETSPSTKGTAPNNYTMPFKAYYWTSTYQPADPTRVATPVGDNDWQRATGATKPITDTGTTSETSNTNQSQYGANTILAGPNLFCPHHAIQPLTNVQTTLTSVLNNLTPVNGGGTILTQGLQWAWLTLSPLWVNDWNLGKLNDQARPLAYSNTGNSKVIIFMTDGMNEIDGINSFYGSASDGNQATLDCNRATSNGQNPGLAPWPECYQIDSWFNAYDRLSSKKLVPPPDKSANVATDSATWRKTAVGVLNQKFADLCATIKNQKITIYTIYYHGPTDDGLPGVNTAAAASMLSKCATDAAHFIASTDAASLNAAFTKIASDINVIRLNQ